MLKKIEMRKSLAIIALSALSITACQKETPYDPSLDNELTSILQSQSPTGSIDYFKLPSSTDYASIPQDPKNPLTLAKVELGKLLFHETGLALDPTKDFAEGTYSCASCHFASAGFQAGRFQGIGDGGLGTNNTRVKNSFYDDIDVDVQPIRTPTAMNGAYQQNMLWNGQFGGTGLNIGTEDQWTAGTPKAINELGYEGLETQAIAGLGVHRLVTDEASLTALGYKAMFDEAFPDIEEANRYDVEFAGLAIAAYERTVLSNQAPFQEWLAGQVMNMTEEEKRGAILFFGEANCASCHTGPALNKMEFHAIGMSDLQECEELVFRVDDSNIEHLGRGGFTKNPADEYKFKTPQLYNLSDSRFYGHGSTFTTIEEVVAYKNAAQAQNSKVPTTQLASQFVPLGLTDSEVKAITVFLESALNDKNLKRYEPDILLSGNCFPNNDELSRYEQGCE